MQARRIAPPSSQAAAADASNAKRASRSSRVEGSRSAGVGGDMIDTDSALAAAEGEAGEDGASTTRR